MDTIKEHGKKKVSVIAVDEESYGRMYPLYLGRNDIEQTVSSRRDYPI